MLVEKLGKCWELGENEKRLSKRAKQIVASLKALLATAAVFMAYYWILSDDAVHTNLRRAGDEMFVSMDGMYCFKYLKNPQRCRGGSCKGLRRDLHNLRYTAVYRNEMIKNLTLAQLDTVGKAGMLGIEGLNTSERGIIKQVLSASTAKSFVEFWRSVTFSISEHFDPRHKTRNAPVKADRLTLKWVWLRPRRTRCLASVGYYTKGRKVPHIVYINFSSKEMENIMRKQLGVREWFGSLASYPGEVSVQM